MSTFAYRLRTLREKSTLTQQQLAERAGMHKLTVAKLEQGLREPSWATVRALAEALGVDCLAFSERPGEPVPEKRRPGRPPKAAPSTPPAGDLEAVPKKGRGRPRKGK